MTWRVFASVSFHLPDYLVRLLSLTEGLVLKYHLEGNYVEDNTCEAIAAYVGRDAKTVGNALQGIKRRLTLRLESRWVLL